MKYYSTNKGVIGKSFKDVLLDGLAPDGGLYIPESFPILSDKFLEELPEKTFSDIALEISKLFIDDIPELALKEIIADAFSKEAFLIENKGSCPELVEGSPTPLVKISDNLYIQELFHGPTMAFKDFGARFMSRAMEYFLKENKQELKIIVATSGDTGSAVAAGFYGVPNLKVYILYPSGKVSNLQEKQLTTFGGNITAIEVKGVFDDCQKLAKQILRDKEINGKGEFSSANSINFGRLLPQMFYYFHGYNLLRKTEKEKEIALSVPSGNFGNLTAGLMAKRIGLPVKKFVASCNINDVVPEYLATGIYTPRSSEKVAPAISNSMNVGNPSNFARMLDMYKNSVEAMRLDIIGETVDEAETAETIKSIFEKTGYLIDTHTAVAMRGAEKSGIKNPIIVLSTAHPVKFKDSIEPIIGKEIEIPEKLKETIAKEKKSILIENDIEELKKLLK
ncbi:threonine synthase [Patescibacteria group bacterium]|nr:threonine synthase [Patescibacteria group bacterium]